MLRNNNDIIARRTEIEQLVKESVAVECQNCWKVGVFASKVSAMVISDKLAIGLGCENVVNFVNTECGVGPDPTNGFCRSSDQLLA